MNFLKKISAFLPWIGYKIVKSFLPNLAIPFAIIISLFSYKKLIRGFVLEWGNLVIFLLAFISSTFFNNFWIINNLSLLMSFFFFFVVSVSLLIGKPFTIQYAKLQIDKKFWNSYLFIRVNKIMTLVLGLIFLTVTLINLYGHYYSKIINDYMVWTIALTIKMLFIKHFPTWYKKRYLLKHSKEGDF